MAEVSLDDPAPVVVHEPTAAAREPFVKRELSGATFLSLEHALHMLFVIIVAGLLASGIAAAISLWTDSGGGVQLFGAAATGVSIGDTLKQMEAMAALGIVAGLLVFVPLLVLFDRRTRAEWLKRPGYSQRLAYKLPIYGALAVLFLGKLVADVVMVTVVLQSLAVIGVADQSIGSLYLTQFVPALATAVIFGLAGWYVFKLAKGRDMGGLFSMAAAVLGLVLVVALLITSILVVRGEAQNTRNPYQNNFEDIFRY